MPEPGVVRSLTYGGDRPPLELVLQTRCRFAVYVHGFPCGSGYVTCPTYCGVISCTGARATMEAMRKSTDSIALTPAGAMDRRSASLVTVQRSWEAPQQRVQGAS